MCGYFLQSSAPFGLYATRVPNPAGGLLTKITSLPPEIFQIRTVPSRLVLASDLPSGLNARPITKPAWPVSVSSSCPLAASQTLM
jgi:hypothetical protein